MPTQSMSGLYLNREIARVVIVVALILLSLIRHHRAFLVVQLLAQRGQIYGREIAT